MQCVRFCKVIATYVCFESVTCATTPSLNLNGKDLIPRGVTLKNAANRLLKRCIFLGNAFRVRTDPYLVARRSSGTLCHFVETQFARSSLPVIPRKLARPRQIWLFVAWSKIISILRDLPPPPNSK